MIEQFMQLYGSSEGLRIFRAPGRVNLIGEHTDYNLGFVLPMALDLATYVAAAPSGDGKLRLYSEDKRDLREWDVTRIRELQRARNWTDYPIGVAQELLRCGFPIEASNLYIRSTVPEGAGLSSSAALEVSSALAFLSGRVLDALELARLCQRAERNFVGMPSGIMDQYVSIFGREHSAVEIDCRSLTHHFVRLPDGIALVAANTMVKHALSASAYRERVQECAAAVEQIRQQFPSVESLRDVTPAQFESVEGTLPPVIGRRARHVITENLRVQQFIDASRRSDLHGMGKLLLESHRSLQMDYEVSCAELDFLVEAALAIDGVYGSRMTGGGFGGCTVNLLRADVLPVFWEEIGHAYERKFRMIPQMYRCTPSAGASEIHNFDTIPVAA